MVGKEKSKLSKFAKQFLSGLKEEGEIKVFVTPTCPYYPQQVINAISCAIENSLISVEIIECREASKLCDRYGVGAVPYTVINEITTSIGAQNEAIASTDLIIVGGGSIYTEEKI